MLKVIHKGAQVLFDSILKEKDVHKYLAQLKKHHEESYEHSMRVGFLCINLGYKLSLSEEDIKLLGYAGLFHDIGKLSIPKWILQNKNSLTKKQREILNGHPRLGFLRIKEKKYEDAKRIMIAHHECKLHPYPRHKKERRKEERENYDRREASKKINLLAQVLAVADIYDALSHKRAYKKALTKKKLQQTLEKEFNGNKEYIEYVLDSSLGKRKELVVPIIRKRK